MITAPESLSVWSGEAIKVFDAFLINLQQSKKFVHPASSLSSAWYNKKDVLIISTHKTVE